MDRTIFKIPFQKALIPRWICPKCEKGFLKLCDNSFFKQETSSSHKAHKMENWYPGDVEYVYSCLLQCSIQHCSEVVSNSGIGYVDFDISYDEEGYPSQDWEDYFRPKYFQPHLNLFNLPKCIPKDVGDAVKKSFTLFFCSPPSAANHIRISVEHLLTYLKVKRVEIKNGRKSLLSLHRRIDLIPTKYAALKENFMAIKWIGNAGSHASKEIKMDDVMDAYEIMEITLHEIFDNKKDHIKKLTKKINKKKGPK